MRIIGGEFRSRRLAAPKGTQTRPTLDATRESLFNIIAGQVSQKRILDLFAGSGALGLEALSRGANNAVFCDKSKEAVDSLRTNVKNLGVENLTVVLRMDWSLALDQLASGHHVFDIIFIDPPYITAYEPVISKIDTLGLLDQNGMIILERGTDGQYKLPQALTIKRTKQYRHTAIDFIRHLQEELHENSHLSGEF